MSVSHNNNFIVGANIENKNDKQAWLFGLNGQKEVLWNKVLRKDKGTIMRYFSPTKDNGIIVVGSKINDYGQKIAWIVKLKNERATLNNDGMQANMKPPSSSQKERPKPNYVNNRPPQPNMKPPSSQTKPKPNTAREIAKRDSEAPQITVYKPIVDKNKSITVRKNSIQIEGIVRDKSKLVSIQIGEYPQNVSRTSTKKSEFSATIHLKVGQNKIDIRAIDEHGNLATETLLVTYETIKDVAGPELQITSPILDASAFATVFEKNVRTVSYTHLRAHET